MAALPQLGHAIGIGGMILLGLGGVLYTLGAVVYAVKRPDSVPSVFVGYHEVFHTLVIAAAALQCAVIAFWIIPA